jgi:hypothetical protein
MHKLHADADGSRKDNERERGEQFPVNTHVGLKVHFDTNVIDGDLIRIVVMNDQETSRCSPYHEYHYSNTSVSVESITAFTMRCSPLEVTQQSVDSFAGSMALHLETAQAASWQRGVYVPQGVRKRLYKAVDPDDRTKMIGVLIEQDAEGKLEKLTWYKTQDAKALFVSTPPALEFEIVNDDAGAPSLDPNDIAGWTWYYTTSIASRS